LSRYIFGESIGCGSFIFIALSSFVTMTISVDCIEAASFTTYLNNEFGIKIAPGHIQVHDKRN
jgi:spore coat protein U-like protein